MGVKAVSAVLIVEDRFALQLRDGKAPKWPNRWGLFGGGIEPGESSLMAVVREIREELELDVSGAQHLMDIGPVRIFVSDVTRGWAGHVLHEGEAAGLFTIDQAMRLELNEITAAALAAARETR
jgi:8-oxo-dGTP pyrophosphatase MutT (NUDIX family)